MIRMWVDDLRPAPEGWVHVTTAKEAVFLLSGHIVAEISLDHDLGDGSSDGTMIANYIEQSAHDGFLKPIVWHIHSANPVGRDRMTIALKSADRAWGIDKTP